MTNSSNSTFEVRGLDKMGDYADIKSSPKQEDEVESAPPMRVLALEFSSGASCSKPIKDSLASSSRSGLKQQFIEMGFLPNHVDRVFEDHSEENFELLLEGLIAYSVDKKSSPEFSDSLDEMFGDWKDQISSNVVGPELKLPYVAVAECRFQDIQDSKPTLSTLGRKIMMTFRSVATRQL